MTPLDQLHIDTVENTEITVEKILGDRKYSKVIEKTSKVIEKTSKVIEKTSK